jgi:hypothetical protein
LVIVCSCDEKPRSVAPTPSASAIQEEQKAHVRFTPTRWTVGEKWKSERDSELKVSVEFRKESGRIGVTESRRREVFKMDVEVLGLVGAYPGKVRVHYDRYQFQESNAKGSESGPVDIEGKTFVVDATNQPVVVTTDAGGELSEAVSERVRGHFANLAAEDPVVESLGTRPIEIGKTFPLRQGLFRALLGATAGEYKGGRVSIAKMKESEGKPAAEIAWTAELETPEDNGVTMKWHIKGLTFASLDRAAVRASWDYKDVVATAVVLALVATLYLYFSFWIG